MAAKSIAALKAQWGSTDPKDYSTDLTDSLGVLPDVTAEAAELNKLAGVTAGTVTASKAVVVDANKDIGDFRNLDVTNLDAGASGTAGTVDVFPTTASKGKLIISAQDATGNTNTTIRNAASMAQATVYTLRDPVAATAAIPAGTQVALIGDPAAGGTQDAEARTAINAIIDALQAFGMVATS